MKLLLQPMSYESEKSSWVEKMVRWILIAVSALIFVMLVLSIARIGLLSWVYSTVFDWSTVRLGFDVDLARLAAVSVTGVFAVLLPTLAWTLIGRKQVLATALVISSQALICVLVYSVGNNVCFDRRSGATLCYYADTPTGRKFSRTAGVDPVTGAPFLPYTSAVALTSAARRKNEPVSESIPRPTQTRQVESGARSQVSSNVSSRTEMLERSPKLVASLEVRLPSGNLSNSERQSLKAGIIKAISTMKSHSDGIVIEVSAELTEEELALGGVYVASISADWSVARLRGGASTGALPTIRSIATTTALARASAIDSAGTEIGKSIFELLRRAR